MDRPLLSIAYLVMEAAWLGGLIATWGRWIDPGDRPALLPLAAVLATLFAGFLAGGRLLRRQTDSDDGGARWRGRPALALGLGVLWSVVVVWLSRHAGEGAGWLAVLGDALSNVWAGPAPDLIALLVALYLWWRGQRAGLQLPDYAAVVRSFGLGSLLLSASLIAATTRLGTPSSLALAAPLFLAGGLVALTLGRLQDVRSEIELGEVCGSPTRLSAGWARAAALPIAAVLVAAGVAAAALGDESFRAALLAALGALLSGLWNVLYWPLLVAGYVAEWLIVLLRRLPPPQPLPQEPQAEPDPLAELRRLAEGQNRGLPGWAGALRWVALAIAAAVALAIFFATSRVARHEREAGARPVDERESLWSWRGAWHALLDWMRARFGRWRSQVQRLLVAAQSEGGERREKAADDVRAVYRRVLALGRTHGLPRRPAQTAGEYRAAWRDTLPGESDVGEITATYQQVRYGRDTAALPSVGPGAALARLVEHLGAPARRLPASSKGKGSKSNAGRSLFEL